MSPVCGNFLFLMVIFLKVSQTNCFKLKLLAIALIVQFVKNKKCMYLMSIIGDNGCHKVVVFNVIAQDIY